MSANVSGFGKTMRITLNDNLLRRGSLEEIEAVMGHEMGHYVLNHIPKDMTFFLMVIGAGVRVPALVAGLVSEALGHEVGDSRRQRSGGAAAGGAAGVDLLLRADAVHEHAHSHGRSRGRHVRNQRQPPAGWLRAGRDSPRRVSQDEARTRWRSGSSSTIPADTTAFIMAMQWKAENLQLFAAPSVTAAAANGTSGN